MEEWEGRGERDEEKGEIIFEEWQWAKNNSNFNINSTRNPKPRKICFCKRVKPRNYKRKQELE